MKKILLVAQREFFATAGTRAFLFGVLLTPVLLGVLMVVMPRMLKEVPPKIQGEVAIVDPTGQLTSGLTAYLQPERIAERRDESLRRMQEVLPAPLQSGGGARPAGANKAIEAALGEVPTLRVVPVEPGPDLEAAKAPLKAELPKDPTAFPRLALLVVHPDAIVKAAGKNRFGSYDLFIRAKLDDRLEKEISDGIREAIIEARVRQSGLNRQEIEALTRIDRVTSRTVTAAGEGRTNELLNRLMPMAFMILLLMSLLMSGQYLLTTTVEEKSNRVVEVLLSAVSPMELMVGKILGQMTVGLLVLVLYLGLGVIALLNFASLGLLDPMLILYLLVFYLLAYFTFGAFMAAIGSAVNEMREAQGLMTPVMLVLMIPYMLWLPISRDPNSAVATVMSFIPAVGSFVMMLRLSSATPPPAWQTALAIVTGAGGVVVALWFAAKVFRIGVLMFGKPPTFGTLVRWVRMS